MVVALRHRLGVLGHELLADNVGEPVPVVRTPADWLSASGRALCLLDWSDASPAWRWLRAGPALSFTDEALRQQVRNALVRSAPMPPMELQDAA